MEASTIDAIEMLVNSEGLLLASVDKTREHLILQKPPPPTVATEESTEEEEPFISKEEKGDEVEKEDEEDKEKPCCELDDSDFEVDPVIIPLDAVRQLNDSRMQLQLWKGMAMGFAACFAGVIFHTC
jgi:hypothetical protein